MTDRRGRYFAFQGLFMAVLLLLFLYNRQETSESGRQFLYLAGFLSLSLIFIRFVSQKILLSWWAQAGLFLGDVALASLTLHWTRANSDLYLIYFLIIFGTALTRNFLHTLVVAALTTVLYILPAWTAAHGLPDSTEFWLKIHFLWVTTLFLAILSQDTQQAQQEQEQQYQEKLRQVESLATLGQVAGEIAHRIKAPLTTILVNSEVLSHRFAKSHETLKELSQIQEEVERCKEILKNLLDLGRIEEMDFMPLDLRESIRSALKSISPQIRKFELELEIPRLTSPLMVRGDVSLLHEAILAVLQNAVDASRRCGKIQVSVRKAAKGLWWLGSRRQPFHILSIKDHGQGIALQNIEHVFKPFFTTKGREGSGLGLSAALRILQKHGGFIEAQSDGIGQGACFVLKIPALGRSHYSKGTRLRASHNLHEA